MNTLYLDFETRGEDISNHGAARHLSADFSGVNCMAYAINNGPIAVRTYYECTRANLIPLLVDLINSVDRVVAHTAQFEMMVLAFTLRMPVYIPKWACTMAKAAYYGYPLGLDDAAKALDCSSLKDVQGKAVMKKLATGLYTPETNPDDFNRLYSYCAADILPMREIDLKLPSLPTEVQEQWELDAEINLRGMPVDVSAINNAIPLIGELKYANDAKMDCLTDGKVYAVTQVQELTKWVRSQGVEMIDCVADTVEKLLQTELPENVRGALTLRQETGLSSLSKYAKLAAYQVAGRLYGMAIFYGTHTGRPTGTGPQMLNLPRGDDPVKWAQLLAENPELFTVISKPDERLKEALRGVISCE